MRVEQAAGKAVRLNGEQLLGALGKVVRVVGDEGRGVDKAAQFKRAQRLGERNCLAGPAHALAEVVVGAALEGEKAHVRVGKEQPLVKRLRLGQLAAVLINQRMPGKDHVLRGLIRPGPGVDIGRRQTRGLGGHQFAR